MWILAIPVGSLALLGAFLAAQMLTKFFKRIKLGGTNPEALSYGAIVLSTAFMVVPWLLPPIGILRGIVALAFLIYLLLGMRQIYRMYKATRRAAELTAITVSSVAVGPDRKTLADSLLKVAALVASQAPDISNQMTTALQRLPEFVDAQTASNLQEKLQPLVSEASDAFGKVALLQDLQVLRAYPDLAQKASILAHNLAKDSRGPIIATTLAEIDQALGLN
jgi:hypothetical protein